MNHVFLQVHSCSVSIPGRALGGVIEGMRKDLPEEVYSIVTRFHSDVVTLLKAGGQAPEVEQRLKEAKTKLTAAALEQGSFPERREQTEEA